MAQQGGKVAWVFADDLKGGTCKSERCGAAITWATFAKSGRKCPFDGELVGLRTGTDQASGRPTLMVDLERSHYATCPDAARFSTRATPASGRGGAAPAGDRTGSVQGYKARKECETALQALRSLYRATDPPSLEPTLQQTAEALKRAIEYLGGPAAATNRAGRAARRAS